MATAETTTAQTPAQPRRLTLAEYDELGESGQLSPDDRVELLDGMVVEKMTKGPRHVAIAHRIFVALLRGLPAGWHCRHEAPINLPSGPVQGAPSRPEPDVTVRRGLEGTIDDRHPLPDDLVLVVEVSSERRRLSEDRKGLARYAFNSVPCVWLVNLASNVIEVYTRPTGPGEDPVYEEIAVKRPGETIQVPLDGPDEVNLDVADLLA